MKQIFSLIATLCLAGAVTAQETAKDKISANKSGSDTAKTKKYLTVGTGGIHVGKKTRKDGVYVATESDSTTEDKVFDIQFGMLDLGFNYLQDKTDYSSPGAQAFLNVNQDMKNENLFSLREGKSINVNIYPVLFKYRLVKTKHQRLFLSAGIGLQMYNFRFNKSISYVNDTKPMVIMDSINFSKNKLAVNYLSVPLMLTSKTKLAKDVWLVYGVGVTAGYRIGSWTKQISDERGKDKNSDPFNLNNFNSCVTGEFGVDGYFRLYASYQLTALHDSGLNQHPFSIGVRFLGI